MTGNEWTVAHHMSTIHTTHNLRITLRPRAPKKRPCLPTTRLKTRPLGGQTCILVIWAHIPKFVGAKRQILNVEDRLDQAMI